MADIAAVFHWSLTDMDRLTIMELAEWRERAVKRAWFIKQEGDDE